MRLGDMSVCGITWKEALWPSGLGGSWPEGARLIRQKEGILISGLGLRC